MINLPDRWSDWNVVDMIGEGTFASVYEAERKDDPTILAAIKVISIPNDESEIQELASQGFDREQIRQYFNKTAAEFIREVKVMECFKGTQNIVSIEDYMVEPKEGGIGSTVFIRMELLTPLDRYISDKTLSNEDAARIGADVCSALTLCASRDLIHRDIKPENIFVNDKIGANVFYKLGDFGIARTLEHRTAGMSSKGTPNYIAPEAALGKPYDARADIYSLGLTLYRLLNNNRLPFFPQTQLYSPSAKREALMRRMAGEKLESPVNASPEMAEVILKACAYQPEDRYQNAEEMKKALLALSEKKPETPPSSDLRPGHGDNEIPDPKSNGEKKNNLRNVLILSAVVLALGAVFLWVAGLFQWNIPPIPTEPPIPTAAVSAFSTPVRASAPIPDPTPAAIPEEGVVASGTCGDHLNWKLDDHGVLTIAGTGKMDDFELASGKLNFWQEEEKIYLLRDDQGQNNAPWDPYWDAIKKVCIEEGVASVGSHAFLCCTELTEVSFPDSVSDIGFAAFAGCGNLAGIRLPESLTVIGENAFLCCSSLTGLEIPSGVSFIGDGAFGECSGLTSVTLPKGLPRIGACLFWDCTSLTGVVIPEGPSSIEQGAFAYCSALAEVVIPRGITYIGQSAFTHTSLHDVIIPEGVTDIGDLAFFAANVRSVSLPASIVKIGNGAFFITNLKDVYYGGTEEEWNAISIDASNENEKALNYEIRQANVHYQQTVIGLGRCGRQITWTLYGDGTLTFSGSGDMQSFIVLYNWRSFGYDDEGNSANTEELLENTIPWYPHRESIQRVVLEHGITSIGNYAFFRCGSLRTVVIPESVKSIGSNAFESCTGLAEISIPDGVSAIGYDAFRSCTGLKRVLIPDSVTDIGESAFESCSGLTEITLPGSVTLIGDKAFASCTGLTEFVIPSGITQINNGVFDSCTGLKKISIPNSVTFVGNSAFSSCSGLESVSLPDSVVSIGKHAFSNCTGLTDFSIPKGVTAIEDDTFRGCSSLTDIMIPNKVTLIGEHAFAYCSGLKHVSIPNSVTSIGESAFYYCDALAELTIPASVTSIGQWAFFCAPLTNVTYTGTREQWDAIVINLHNDELLSSDLHFR